MGIKYLIVILCAFGVFAGTTTDTVKATKVFKGPRGFIDTVYSLKDTSKLMKTDSGVIGNKIFMSKDIQLIDSTRGLILKAKDGTTRKYWRIRIDSAGAITADSAGIN